VRAYLGQYFPAAVLALAPKTSKRLASGRHEPGHREVATDRHLDHAFKVLQDEPPQLVAARQRIVI